MKSLWSSYGDKGQVSGIQKENNGLTHLESTFAIIVPSNAALALPIPPKVRSQNAAHTPDTRKFYKKIGYTLLYYFNPHYRERAHIVGINSYK